MDVHCSSCGEPWDTHHLLHDSIHDTQLSESECEDWARLAISDRLTPELRSAFAEAGWRFGRTLLHVIHCPSCGPDDEPDRDQTMLKSTFEEILGDDLDGIASEFTDHQL